MKFVGIIIMSLFASGCTGIPVMDNISNVFTAKSVVDTVSNEQTTKVTTLKSNKEPKFFGSNHNWNNTSNETTKETVVEDDRGVIEEVQETSESKRKSTLPWPLILIALLSGSLYLINRFRIYKSMR